MRSISVRNATTAVLIVLVAGALAIAFLRPTSEVVIHDDPVNGIDAATVDTALVTARTKEGGFRLLGITFSSPTYRVAVSFSAPPSCLDVVSRASHWPTGNEACGPTGSLDGEISGTGISIAGDTLVSVRFEVSEQCWESVALGDVWSQRSEPSCRA